MGACLFYFKTMKNSTFQISVSRSHLVLSIVLISTVFAGCKKRGCLDPNAMNYDSQAQVEDNSCTYADFQRAEMLENLCKTVKKCFPEMCWPGGQIVGAPWESIFRLSRGSQLPYTSKYFLGWIYY